MKKKHADFHCLSEHHFSVVVITLAPIMCKSLDNPQRVFQNRGVTESLDQRHAAARNSVTPRFLNALYERIA
jgi:hypothetical protein